MLVEFGKSNLLDKAKQQPEKVNQAIEKTLADGFFSTYQSIRSRLDEPLALGYSNVGTVVQTSPSTTQFRVGDRVVSNGPHAELVSVPENLCAHIPSTVSDETAAFTILASIGLQGIRLANPTIGETFVVSGLGLIGLLTAQLLRANGCRVLGLDPDPVKCDLARKHGVLSFQLSQNSDPLPWIYKATNGVGADGVLITATTSSSDPVHIAANACRKRGRIVLIGVTGLELRRDHFYKKELTFQVSCSYGPGRYDSSYEHDGHDYPLAYVRWTQNRNFQAILDCMASGSLLVDDLISHRYSFLEAPKAYDLLCNSRSSLGILLHYPTQTESAQRSIQLRSEKNLKSSTTTSEPILSFIGAGNYSSRVLIPSFSKAGAQLHTIAATTGTRSTYFGIKYDFFSSSTDLDSVFSDTQCQAVVIATRHNSHAALVVRALNSGKHVFVEKPLCLTLDELASIESAYTGSHVLMVGFNRRFSPLYLRLKSYLSDLSDPKAFVYTCNAGFIPSDHWTQDPAIGGGRLIGEACHFVDLILDLANSPIVGLDISSALHSNLPSDTCTLQLRFQDGSIGTVHYFSNGSKSFPKERLEVFASGRVFQLDNFRRLKAWGSASPRTRHNLFQDKGHLACCSAFLDAIKTGSSSPIPMSHVFDVHRYLLQALNSQP